MQREDQDTVPELKRQSIRDPDAFSQLALRRESRFHPRPSVQYNRRMSMASRTSTSLGTKHLGLFPVKIQNTYRLEPDKGEVFRPTAVSAMMQEVLNECLGAEAYNPTPCRNLSQMIAEIIKGRVKDMVFHRYKLICLVTIGEDANQSASVASRCLWNFDTDNYAEATYHDKGLYAVATTYALYFE